ncbi:MAG TPA: NAD(P)/FAD-dependent oxidoreductase [Ornithinibacter sp.]|nr:NAD(P)/FAD-dependent oxidoreductase [Ornithinibacter sp.]
MSEHPTPSAAVPAPSVATSPAEVDTLVVGGGPAGLSAATVLARSRRSVVVIDAGEPRNASADGVHAFLGHDGLPPGELLARGRDELATYGGRVVPGTAVDAVAPQGGERVTVTCADGSQWSARHLVVTSGAIDGLPDVPGLAEHWGHGVVHCPYCHGWEVRDQRIVVLATSPAAMHQAGLFSQLTDALTVVEHAPDALSTNDRARLQALGIEVVRGPANRVVGSAGRLTGVEVPGRTVDADAVVVASFVEATSPVLTALGLEPADLEMTGRVVARSMPSDAVGRTTVPRVWAAGNVTDPMAQVVMAAAAGTRTGAMVNAELVMEDQARRLAG